MENASKALIIAGAILISILLISLGIMIYNQAKTVTDSQQMDQVAIQQYNSQFEQNVGTKSGAQVRSLINQVKASNALEENESRPVTFTGKYGSSLNEIKNTKKYAISVNYYGSDDKSNNGLVKEIAIDDP